MSVMMRGPLPHLGGAETETRWAAKADGSVEPRRAQKKPPLRPSLRVAAAVATWRSSLQRGGRQTATRSDWVCCMLRRDAGTWNPVRPTRAGRANTPRPRTMADRSRWAGVWPETQRRQEGPPDGPAVMPLQPPWSDARAPSCSPRHRARRGASTAKVNYTSSMRSILLVKRVSRFKRR